VNIETTSLNSKGGSPSKRGKKRHVTDGIMHIQATFNNTIVTISDLDGATLGWSAPTRQQSIKGSKKRTPLAAQLSAASVVKEMVERYGLERVKIKVNGPGPGREGAIRGAQDAKVNILEITDITGYPFNGRRPRKKRRV